jgi:hypothetical protein
MKTMEAFKTIKQNLLKSVLFILVSASAFISNARTGTHPVNPANFTAVLNNNNKVDLKWSTETETNLSHFIVEKSTDGKNFSDAALVFAYGNTTSESDYAFADNISKIKSGFIYYRLVTINADGTMQYSDKRIIKIGKQTDNSYIIIANLNPGTNELKVTIPSKWQNKKVVYELFNANGHAFNMTETNNSNKTETLNVNGLTPGFYIVSVTCNGETAQQKIVKQ